MEKIKILNSFNDEITVNMIFNMYSRLVDFKTEELSYFTDINSLKDKETNSYIFILNINFCKETDYIKIKENFKNENYAIIFTYCDLLKQKEEKKQKINSIFNQENNKICYIDYAFDFESINKLIFQILKEYNEKEYANYFLINSLNELDEKSKKIFTQIFMIYKLNSSEEQKQILNNLKKITDSKDFFKLMVKLGIISNEKIKDTIKYFILDENEKETKQEITLGSDNDDDEEENFSSLS